MNGFDWLLKVKIKICLNCKICLKFKNCINYILLKAIEKENCIKLFNKNCGRGLVADYRSGSGYLSHCQFFGHRYHNNICKIQSSFTTVSEVLVALMFIEQTMQEEWLKISGILTSRIILPPLTAKNQQQICLLDRPQGIFLKKLDFIKSF